VPALLSRWTKLLEAWQTRRALCRDTPQACVYPSNQIRAAISAMRRVMPAKLALQRV